MAQKTGDQIKDIKPALRDEITQWINSLGSFPYHTEKINKIVERKRQEQKHIFGDSIP